MYLYVCVHMPKLTRREMLAMIAAGGVVTAAGIWMPGTKLISIPKRVIVPNLYEYYHYYIGVGGVEHTIYSDIPLARPWRQVCALSVRG